MHARYKRGSHEGWRPDADMYEMLLSWMCTQENLVDEAETIIRKEMPVRPLYPLRENMTIVGGISVSGYLSSSQGTSYNTPGSTLGRYQRIAGTPSNHCPGLAFFNLYLVMLLAQCRH